MKNNYTRVTICELASILGVSRPTATKEYKLMVSLLNKRRTYLTRYDLKVFDLSL